MRDLIVLENTRFLHQPHWSGKIDANHRYPVRSGPIIINDPNLAAEMIMAGCDIRQTVPREGEEEGFVPQYFVYAKMRYAGEGGCTVDPNVYLVSNGRRILLDRETVGQIDDIRIDHVNVVLNVWSRDPGTPPSVYVRTMYCYQALADDPWAKNFMGEGDMI